MATDMIESPLARFSEEELEQLAAEFDKIHDEVFDDLGDRDRRYITSMIALHRRLLVLSRVILLFSKHKPAWAVGTAGLSLAKILENMEIGHNVMHGQWDWMNDPQIHSSTWDWDTASTKEAWKHSHNYIHHTYTNIRGKDKDLGYEIMRIDPHQKWHPVYLFQPVYNVLLAFLFEWGVAFHDMDIEAIRRGEKSQKEALEDLKGIAGKARLQITKDYIAFPLLSGVVNLAIDAALTSLKVTQETRRSRLRRTVSKRMGRKKTTAKAAERVVRELVERRAFRDPFKATVTADATANIIRNVWAYAIIFCGHFPDQCYTFSQEEVENETRGGWYVRQLTGAANIDGSALFHVISGNLGYQVEHHLYPDMPSSRYGEIAPRVRAVCEKWGLPYNTGPFLQQLGMVQRTILRLAFPGGKPRPKPGPYQGPLVRGSGEGDPRSNGHRTPAGAGVGS
jgi:NADPH-dependent stearoyl-CoA 9-desaturase